MIGDQRTDRIGVQRTISIGVDNKATNELMELVAAGIAACEEVGAAALERAARYGNTLERSLFRTLHELERLQARRFGHPVALPVAVDVTMSGPEPH